MKNRASLSLMELGLMLLVFSLAGALCLQAFARADIRSREIRQRDEALLLAQTAAETLKHHRGNFDAAARQLDGTWDGSVLRLEQGGLVLLAQAEETQLRTLSSACIRVMATDQRELAQLAVSWQEVSGHD